MIREETATLLLAELRRLNVAVERLAGPAPAINDWNAADCFVWSPVNSFLQPVSRPNRIALKLIRGVDHVRDILHENTLRFADGFPANNVLLWGARGMGKSSLVKSVHAQVARDTAERTWQRAAIAQPRRDRLHPRRRPGDMRGRGLHGGRDPVRGAAE